MSDLASYLWAQARRAPLATARFAAGEVLRRGRLRFTNSLDHALPSPSIRDLEARFAPFLPAASLESGAFSSRPMHVADSILRRAESTAHGRFQIFGHSFDASHNGGLAWHRDWLTGHRWPLEPPARLRILGAPAGSDIKRPWELGRCHHFLTFGQAYALTRDPIYASAFSTQHSDFLHSNPYPRGIHWVMPMEVAIRAANIATAAAFFSREPSLTPSFWHSLLESLFLHGRYVFSYREWNPVARGNHYLACVAGLAFLGVLFSDHPEGRRWLAFARTALLDEMSAQVAEDGVAHEGSSGYHALVIELFLSASLLLSRFPGTTDLDFASRASAPAATDFPNQPEARDAIHITRSLGEPFTRRLEKMFSFLAALCEGRSAPPRWGDSDDGRFLPFSGLSPDPALELLAVGRTLFSRSEWPAPPTDGEELFWRLGPVPAGPVTVNSPAPPAISTAAFAASGFFFLSSPRLRGSIRCGPLGINGWANHAHCDQLAFELCFDGQPVLVDPGTLAYSSDPAARNLSRSTRSHNTPAISGAEQNRFWPRLLFRILDDTRSRLLRWDVSPTHIDFLGEHSGYARSPLPAGLPFPIIVRRHLLLDRAANSLLITDSILPATDPLANGSASTRDSLPVEWNFPLAPAIVPAPLPSTGDHLSYSLGPLTVAITAPPAANLNASLHSSFVAPRFGQRVPAPLLRIAANTTLPLTVSFHFFPTEIST